MRPGLFSERQWAVVESSLRLSPREGAIVALCFDSLNVEESARRLGISPHTVRTHKKRIYHEAGVNNQFDLLLVALRVVLDAEQRRATGA